MSQTSYTRQFSGAFSGQLGDTGPKRSGTYVNDQGADIPSGIFVAFKSESAQAKKCDLPADAGDQLAGIVLNSFARDPDGLTGTNAVKSGAACNVLEFGAAFMAVEQTMAAGDPVFCRITASGGNTQLGKVRKDSDGGTAVAVPGARVLFGSATIALIFFDAAVNHASELADEGALQIVLTAAAEAANVIKVTGQVKDLRGKNVAAAREVLIRSLAVTADQGDLSDGGDGTLVKAVNPVTGENVAWMTTTATGSFQVDVTNTAAELTLLKASTDNAREAVLKLTFA